MSRDSEETRVDLGDDLLEPTRTLQSPKKSEKTGVSVFDPKDLIASAEIYLSEGFLSDAKKIFQRLWVAPEAASFKKTVRAYLDEIEKKEIEQIFKTKKEKAPSKVPEPPDADAILRKLEADLQLDEAVPRLKMQVLSADFSTKDYIDLSIAFLEMNRLAEAKDIILEAVSKNPLEVELLCIQTEVFILLRDFYPAVESLQVALAQSDIVPNQRIHLMYSMGRLREELKAVAEATFWYQQVLLIDESYRDTSDRMKRLIR